MRRRIALAVIVLVAAVAGSALAGSAVAQDSDSCETVARHDAYRLNAETVNATVNGSASTTVQNTHVTIEPTTGFVHVDARNPNGYCVRVVVEVAPEIVTPATLGSVDATNSSATATWRAVHDFNRSETYTEITFTLAAGSTASFNPAKARVAALKWTGQAKDASAGWLGGFDAPFGDDDSEEPLEKRTYRFTPRNDTDIITVPLENRASNQSIDEYQAVYKTPNRDWRPVSTDSTAPVFKRTLGDGSAVQFQFNENATVKFTANPTWTEQAGYQWTSYWSGVDWLDGFFGGSEEE